MGWCQTPEWCQKIPEWCQKILEWCQTKDGRPPCLFTRCCCCSLRVVVVIIGIIDFMFCIGFVISLLIVLSIVGNTGGRYNILSILLQFLVHGVLSCVLLHAARTENRGLLWAWIWGRGVELITDVNKVILLPLLVYGAGFYTLFFIPIAAVLLAMNVVRSYAIQLKAKDDLANSVVRYDPEEEEVHA